MADRKSCLDSGDPLGGDEKFGSAARSSTLNEVTSLNPVVQSTSNSKAIVKTRKASREMNRKDL